jgi:tripartite-type tricarboxylate transporter receptor subunit TctC
MSRCGQKMPGGCVQGVIVGLLGALALLVTSQQAGAQTWPARPIKFIVSQAAGGTPDIICG